MEERLWQKQNTNTNTNTNKTHIINTMSLQFVEELHANADAQLVAVLVDVGHVVQHAIKVCNRDLNGLHLLLVILNGGLVVEVINVVVIVDLKRQGEFVIHTHTHTHKITNLSVGLDGGQTALDGLCQHAVLELETSKRRV